VKGPLALAPLPQLERGSYLLLETPSPLAGEGWGEGDVTSIRPDRDAQPAELPFVPSVAATAAESKDPGPVDASAATLSRKERERSLPFKGRCYEGLAKSSFLR
jgi:hypothetical protein